MALSTHPIYGHPKKTDSETLKCGFCIDHVMQPHKNNAQNTFTTQQLWGNY